MSDLKRPNYRKRGGRLGCHKKKKKKPGKKEGSDDSDTNSQSSGPDSSCGDNDLRLEDLDLTDDGSHHEQMRRMDEMFQAPFMGIGRGLGGGGPLSLEVGNGRSSDRHNRRQEQRAQNAQVSRRNQFMDPFAHFDSMFSNMRSMMSDMHRAFDQGADNPNTHMYQQSSFYSSSNVGNGTPKVYQASSSVKQIPGGVKETRKTVMDSETGVERVAMGHHIKDRAHIIERSRNSRTGESNENQELINITEEEAPAFDSEYRDRWHITTKGVEQRRRRLRDLTHRPTQSHQRALPEPETNSRRPRKASHRKE
ncbi:hypothetical protein EGW08_001166 [Elysia chlorotica]|uniref:Myeloid leukemia factor 1 n=1 Tax=Elysia chlorotica TaxID=188477 RepID=A0A433UB63_ELYCH|nr:hypothetical protein EGW08_001166 [Elysia chlorotica]